MTDKSSASPATYDEELHKLLDDAGVSRKRSMDGGLTWPEYTLAERVNLLARGYKLAERELNEMTEAEARCCPEDFGFEEYIGILTQRLSALSETRESTIDACLFAVQGELLTDPTDCADDIAYNNAVRDCEYAVLKLKSSAPSAIARSDLYPAMAKPIVHGQREQEDYRRALEAIIADPEADAVAIAHAAITPYTPWVAVDE